MDKFNLDLSLVARLGGHSAPRTHRGKERFPGMTITYGQLADRVHRPKAARAVGQAMRRNRLPIVIPCHRVIGAGDLGGFGGHGSKGRWPSIKSMLLEAESGLRP